jgi:superfamily II DNA/RNA helicase
LTKRVAAFAALSCEQKMTDAFEVLGDLSPVESVSADSSNVNPNPAFNQPLAEFSEPAEVFLADEAEPTEAEEVTPNGFVLLGLAPELIQAVADLGYTQPTTVQLQTIPKALPGQAGAAEGQRFIDLMVSSQTGSGKTAAFLLPVLHTLLKTQADADAKERADFERAVAEAAAKGEPAPKRPKRKDPTNARNFKAPSPGALVVCPTRELAQQVAHDAIELVKHCRGLRVANVVGGMPYQLQIAKLQNADLVVATPGRLLDLQRSMQIKLDQVKFLVVDEADRMLDLGFSDDLAEINQLTSQRQQTMMFSATFAPRIQQLAMRVMHDNGASVQKIQIDSPQEKHANIKQVLFWSDNAAHKRKLLDHWLRDTTIDQAIVFASTQIECDGLANDLQQDGFSAVALHGALSQGLRNRRLMALRQGQVQILVATDVAARGLDVPTVTHVFNFGLPMKAEDYTHRIGRTGRAGRDGIAVTFAEFRDRRKIFDIESYSHQHFKAETIPGLEPTQRFPASAPVKFGKSGFGDRGPRDTPSRDRNFGGGGARGGFGGGNADRHVRGGPRQFGANDGGFGQRDERSYDRRSSVNEGFGGGNRNEGFAPRNGGFSPRNESFAPRNESFAPRNEGFPPRKDGFAPRNEGFAPRGGDFAARKPAFSKPGFAKPVRSGKPFTPHGDAPKRSGGTKVLKITRG